MRSLILTLAGLFSAILWLALLVATGFSAGVVGVGLLAALSISGSAHEHRGHSDRSLRLR